MKIQSSTIQQGFTLIELIVVIVVAIILATVAFPNLYNYQQRLTFLGAASNAKQAIQYARTRALSNPKIHVGIWFEIEKGRYILFFDTDQDNRYRPAIDKIHLSPRSLPKDIRFVFPAVNPISSDSTIIFRGDGSAKLGGSIVILGTPANRMHDTLTISKTSGSLMETR